MKVSDPQFNIVTFFLVFIGVFVIYSMITLFRYFFGGRDPLRWNAVARVEAAQNPANLLQADDDYRNQRRVLGLIFWGAVAVALYKIAPEQSQAVFNAVVVLLAEVSKTVIDGINALLASRSA